MPNFYRVYVNGTKMGWTVADDEQFEVTAIRAVREVTKDNDSRATSGFSAAAGVNENIRLMYRVILSRELEPDGSRVQPHAAYYVAFVPVAFD